MRILIFSLLFFISLPVSPLWAQARRAAGIATAHPAAPRAGHEILAAGGNAFDAAVTVSAVLAVVEPYSSGLGGGGFWLLHRARDGFQVMIDGRETAPGRAHRDMYLDDQGKVRPRASEDGPLAAGIPGVPAAMVHLAKNYGQLTLEKSLIPAIRLAKNGFKVDEQYRRYAKMRLETLQQYPTAASIFLEKNAVPALDYLLKQPDLARTLESIARHGNAGFYQGAKAKQIMIGRAHV